MAIKKLQKVAQNYECDNCDYITSRKSSYDKHILSSKHQKSTEWQQSAMKSCKKLQFFACQNCYKEYKDHSGLWRHSKKCFGHSQHHQHIIEDKELMSKLIDQNMALITQNHEFKQLIAEQNSTIIKLAENGKNSINHTNNTVNSHNKFNLNLYLNETCKDAINITDFVNSLTLTINDLEETARLGYAGGISQIFINGLNQIDVHNRPIHCSDVKREILYIKDDNQWIKDTDDKINLTKAIKLLAYKNMKQITEWQKLHPEYNNPESKQNDIYMKIICGAMSGSSQEESESNYEKIIKNVIKQSVITDK